MARYGFCAALSVLLTLSSCASANDNSDVEVCTGGPGVCSSAETGSGSAPPVPFEVSKEHRALVVELHRQLDQLNKFEGLDESARKKKCASTRAVVISVGGYCKQKGFGGNMWGLGDALKYAYNTKRMVVFAERERWVYADERDCPSQSWSCYFEPLASCLESDLKASRRVALSAKSHKDDERVVHWDNCQFRQIAVDMIKEDPALKAPFLVPEPFRALTGNVTAFSAGWYGAAIDYGLRPKAFILERVEAAKQRLRWHERTRPTIGLHVRRGEKWTDCGKPCERRELALYMSAARAWRGGEEGGAGGFGDVYVATDGDTVMAQLRDQFGEFRYFYNEEQYRDDTGEFEYILKTNIYPKDKYLHINRTDCMVNTLIDLILLADCDAFIGTGMSNFSNMAYALLLARLGVPLLPPCALKSKFRAPPAPATSPCLGPLQHAADGSDFAMVRGFG